MGKRFATFFGVALALSAVVIGYAAYLWQSILEQQFHEQLQVERPLAHILDFRSVDGDVVKLSGSGSAALARSAGNPFREALMTPCNPRIKPCG